MNRREFFKAFVPLSRKELLRPPYAKGEFHDCSGCEAPCMEACETGIISLAKDGSPYLSFSKGGCTFCGECAKACPKGVLSLSSQERIRALVRINPKVCGAWQGVLCFSCKEPCLDNAIKFEGLGKPVILQDRCTSCGFCVSTCPAGAIEVVPL